MKVVGLTGGIGSGKSMVSRLLNTMGIPVYVADTESKRLTESSPVIRKKLIEKFGDDIYKERKLNKALLASLIFGNDDHRRYVNSVIHPVVRTDFERWKALQMPAPLVVIEAAILFESGFSDSVDILVTVAAPEDLRIRRVELRDGLPQASIVSRIRSQLPEEEKIRRSDYVIYNDGQQALIPQVEKMLEKVGL